MPDTANVPATPAAVKLPPWQKLYPQAPNPVRDPEKDTVWTMLRWGFSLTKECISTGNFKLLAGAVYGLVQTLDTDSEFALGPRLDPLTLTVSEFRKHIPQLEQKWAKLPDNWDKKPGTPAAYRSRSERIVNEYAEWCKAGETYQCKLGRSGNGSNGNGVAKKAKKRGADPAPDPAPAQAPEPPTPATGSAIAINCADGRWVVPVPEALSVADIRRMVLALLLEIRRDDLMSEALSLFGSEGSAD